MRRVSDLDAPELMALRAESSGGLAGGNAELVRAALARLPESQRIVLLLRYAENLTYEEMAAYLDVSVGVVRRLLQRAKHALREAMSAQAPHHRAGSEAGDVPRASESASPRRLVPAGSPETAAPGVTEGMRKNAAWLATHGGLLANFGDVWVAICGGRPVSQGESPTQALQRAKAAGHAVEDILLAFAGEDSIIC